MNITVLGWYGHGNAGDETYKSTFPLFLPGHNFHFTDKITEEDKKNSDIFILGGGAVASISFMQQLKDVKQPKYMVSVSVDKDVPVNLLHSYKKILVRDIGSQQILADLGFKSELIADLAFLLEIQKTNTLSELFKQEGHELYNKVVSVVYNAHLLRDRDHHLARDYLHFDYVTQKLAEIMDRTSASFVFIPFGHKLPWDDRVTNSWLSARCKFWKKNFIIYEKINFQDLLNIIAQSDAVISTRLHASIFSCIANVPFIDLTHHNKNMGFLQTVGKTDWSCSYWKCEFDKLESLLKDFLKSDYKTDLKDTVKVQKDKIRNVHFF